VTIGSRVEFRVDELVVDIELSETEAQRLTPVLRAAFEDVAKRLRDSPASRWQKEPSVVLRALRVDSLSADELLGPRGAARLADAFWNQMLTSRSE
jgi:hypothetical protein